MGVPKTRCSGTMTEAAFWAFIRSGLRQKSRRWRPIFESLAAAKRPSKSKNKRLKWEYKCAKCKRWKPGSEVSVDHKQPVGSLRSSADLAGFVERLFCEVDNLQVLCQGCHDRKTKEDKQK